MKKLFALILALCMIFALAACSSPKLVQAPDGAAPASAPEKAPEPAPAPKTAVGTWEGKVDFSTILADQLEEEPEMAVMLDGVSAKMILELKEDGNFTFSMDMSDSKDALRENVKKYFLDYLETNGMTAEQFEEMSGQSLDQMIEAMVGELDAPDPEMNFAGTYTEEAGKVLLNREDKEPLEGTWAEDTLSLDLEGVKVDFARK